MLPKPMAKRRVNQAFGLVTRGPGATNASIGVHAAYQDATPMLLFVGQVPRAQATREAFQEINYGQMFGSIAKWAAQIEDAARIPEYVSRAFHLATSGRPGPVVLSLPEDMQLDRVTVADAAPLSATARLPLRRRIWHASRHCWRKPNGPC